MINDDIKAIKVPITVDGVVYVLIVPDDDTLEYYLINREHGNPVYMFGTGFMPAHEAQRVAESSVESYLPEEWNVAKRTFFQVERQEEHGDWHDICLTYDHDEALKAARWDWDCLLPRERKDCTWWIHAHEALMCKDIPAEEAWHFLVDNSCDGPEPADSEECVYD